MNSQNDVYYILQYIETQIKYLLKYYAFQNIIFIDRETIIGELLPLSEDLTTGEFLP